MNSIRAQRANAREAHTFRKHALLVFGMVVACISQSASASPDHEQQRNRLALSLLSRYGLQVQTTDGHYRVPESVAGLSSANRSIFDTTSEVGRRCHAGILAASRAIGLKPTDYAGQRLTEMTYLLTDSTQWGSALVARFLFADTQCAAAYVLPARGLVGGGALALNDRSQYRARGFTFPYVRPQIGDTISVVGPWDRVSNCWTRCADFTSARDLEAASQALSRATKMDWEVPSAAAGAGEEYMLLIRFRSGELYCPHFVLRVGTLYLTHETSSYRMGTALLELARSARPASVGRGAKLTCTAGAQ